MQVGVTAAMSSETVGHGSEHNLHHDSGPSAAASLPTPSTADQCSTPAPPDGDTNGTDGTLPTVLQPNGHAEASDDILSDRPPKKRKLADPQPKSRSASRPASPPWKSATAEGPTTIIENGRRKSGRVNPVPSPSLDAPPRADKHTPRAEQADGRPTRGHARVDYSSLHNGTDKPRASRKNVRQHTPSPPAASRPQTQKTQKHKRQSKGETVPPTTNGTNAGARKTSPLRHRKHSSPHEERRASGRLRKSDATASIARTPPVTPTANGTTTAVSDTARRTPSGVKLKLRFREKNLPLIDPDKTFPVMHPGQILRPKQHSSFHDWLQHDDALAGESDMRLTEEQAKEQALLRWRINDALEGGKVKVPEKLIEEAKPEEDAEERADEAQGMAIPKTYGHWSHVAAHAVNFSKLLGRETVQHRQIAKRLAIAAAQYVRQKNKDREPQSAEELWELQRGYDKKRWQQVVKDIEGRWNLVRQEVTQMRIIEWEKEQQAKGNQAMDELLGRSTYLLSQRRHRHSSDLIDDDEEGDDWNGKSGTTLEDADDNEGSDVDQSERQQTDSDEEASESDSENMTSDSDEEDQDNDQNADEELSLEALREKYQNLQESSHSASDDETSQDHSRLHELLDDGGEEAEDVSISRAGATADDEIQEAGLDDGVPETAESDYANVQMEEVDPMLLDEDDDSSIATEDDSDRSSESHVDASESRTDDEVSGAEEEDENPLLMFLSKKDREKVKLEEAATPPLNGIVDSGPTGPDADVLEHSMKKQDTGVAEEDSSSHQGAPDESDDHVADQAPDVEESALTPVDNRTAIPSLLRGTLREYQHDGLHWLAGLYSGDTNGILADEMGLGKTIQTIALLAYLATHHHVWGTHLIVVPTSVILNWEMEFKKFLPGFKVLSYYGTQDERKEKRRGWRQGLWNAVITSYQIILKDAAAFKQMQWHYLVLDEAHNIKNYQSQRWQTLLKFNTQKRLLLTGTPLQNSVDELWSLLYFLMPPDETGQSQFAELQDFVTAMKRPTTQILDQGKQELDAEAQARVKQLHGILRPYILRRLKAQVEKQMPAKYEHVVYCRLSKRQRQLYDGFMGRADTKATLSSGNYMSIIACLMSLRKVCNHPDLFEERAIVTSFAMPRSAVASYEINELLVRRRLLQQNEMDHINMKVLDITAPSNNLGVISKAGEKPLRTSTVSPIELLVERQTRRLKPVDALDGSSIQSTLAFVSSEQQKAAAETLKLSLDLTRRNSTRRPVYSDSLIKRLSLNIQDRYTRRSPAPLTELVDRELSTTSTARQLMPILEDVSSSQRILIQKFGCVTPTVVAQDLLPLTLTRKGAATFRALDGPSTPDPFHEPRIRLSIAFPDKRLLQYDCGKLQRLDALLRQLQAGGHRALIFTQMTKVLDVLERFLNIHGHRYLRLDGATRIEQRQFLTERFNNDPRILCFILSSRSGGLGINLTGADTVIFYDLDWNPAMDKQCQDRCHRIGQTREVHIYRFVSEYTIEANILRKSNQKRLLDDVIIQKGEFTTDTFNRVTYKDAFQDDSLQMGEDAEAGAALDQILGDNSGFPKVLETVEEKEDVAAAKVAQKEMREMEHEDHVDFDESTGPSATPKTSVPPTPLAIHDGVDEERPEDGEWPHVDEYMLRFMTEEMKNMVIKPPSARDKKKKKKGADHIRIRR